VEWIHPAQWHRVGKGDWLLLRRSWTFGFHKRRVISWVFTDYQLFKDSMLSANFCRHCSHWETGQKRCTRTQKRIYILFIWNWNLVFYCNARTMLQVYTNEVPRKNPWPETLQRRNNNRPTKRKTAHLYKLPSIIKPLTSRSLNMLLEFRKQ
jgi:hypothetical protein